MCYMQKSRIKASYKSGRLLRHHSIIDFGLESSQPSLVRRLYNVIYILFIS